jgi:hypothetical protein
MVLITGLRPTPTITHAFKLHRECRRSGWFCSAHAAGDVERERKRGDNGLGMRLKWLVSWQAGRFAQRGQMQEACSLSLQKVFPPVSKVAREACAFIFELGAEFLMPRQEADVAD